MHKQLFISGIDTDCGKTYITGLLARYMREAGVDCITSKLVQTGCLGVSEDIIAHREAMEMELLPEDISGKTCPIVYSFPASPHLSAAIDNRPFAIGKVEEAFAELVQKYELVLTEGAGGLAVPLTTQWLTSDYLKEKQLPLVLVCSSRLGSINHSLLSIDFCVNNNIKFVGVVYNQFPDDDEQMAQASYQFLQEYIAARHPSIRLIHGHELTKESTLHFVHSLLGS